MSSGRQQLPEKFNVSTGGQLPQEIFLDREIDLDAWMLEGNDKVRGLIDQAMQCTHRQPVTRLDPRQLASSGSGVELHRKLLPGCVFACTCG